MRVTNKSLHDSILIQLNAASSEMVAANQIISSGKKINRPSDDPVGLVSVMHLKSSLANLDQLERNLSTGKSWLEAGESALSETENILSQTRAFCVQMSSANVSAADRANAVEEVEGYLQQILALANTEVGGRYIFGGTKTDAAPFVLSESGEVTYQGNETPFSIKIGKNMDLAIGREGEKVFGGCGFDWHDPDAGRDNIFKTLIDLKEHLRLNEPESVRETLGRLEDHLDTIQSVVSNTGAKALRLETKSAIIEDLRLGYTERKSGIEDCDIAEAVMNLKSKELAYQASLASSSRVMQLTLADYL